MTPVLQSFGFVISGPVGRVLVPDKADIQPTIAALAAAQGYDPDDYAATEVFAKAWHGRPLDHDHSLDWDVAYKHT